jgi:hypothetical protein
MRVFKSRACVAALGLGSAACGFTEEAVGTLGELGEGSFQYACIEDGDAVCNETTAVDAQAVRGDLGDGVELPAAVAVGARFDLTYQGTVELLGEPLLVAVEPARPDVVDDKGGFVVREPGNMAFLARNPGKDVTADLVHLRAERVDGLELWHDEQRVKSITMKAGNETHVAVVPLDAGGVRLAGAVRYTWTASDAAILGVDEPGTTGTPTSGVEIANDEVRLVALAAGAAKLSVESRDDHVKELSVVVEPEVAP